MVHKMDTFGDGFENTKADVARLHRDGLKVICYVNVGAWENFPLDRPALRFDAVEPDLVEGFSNDTGFPLTASDRLRHNRMIASIAHERGLSVGLKNDLPQNSRRSSRPTRRCSMSSTPYRRDASAPSRGG